MYNEICINLTNSNTNKIKLIFYWSKDCRPPVQNSAMSSSEPAQDIEGSDNNFKLSNIGNKLTGEENPGSIRPKMWTNKRSFSDDLAINDQDFEVYLL